MALARSLRAALSTRLRISGAYGPPVFSHQHARLYSTKDKEEEEEEVGEEVSDCGEPAPMSEDEAHHDDSLQRDTKYAKKPPVQVAPFGDFGPGIYKGILLGIVGQTPIEKVFKNGLSVVIFSLGTGGLRNNRRQMEGEDSESYAERSFTQWHRICVFKAGLLGMASKIKKGTNVYVEGNIETRVFSDPVTGIVKRIRELCIRQSGRLYVVDPNAVV